MHTLSHVGLWRSLRTAFELANRVDAVEQRCDDLELEWIDKRDALDRLLRRLALRESRSGPILEPVGADPNAPAVERSAPGLDKAGLRQVARARGLIR